MTAQLPEHVHYRGKMFYTRSYLPLPKKKKDTRVIYNEDFQEDPIFGMIESTACWRRYVGTWTIDGGKLYLSQLEGWRKMTTSEPIFADWISGSLTLEPDQRNMKDRFEIEIEKGCVVREMRLEELQES